MTAQPLLDEEFEIVHEILERFGDKRAMNLEQLDGFLAAVLCGPEDALVSQRAKLEQQLEALGSSIASLGRRVARRGKSAGRSVSRVRRIRN